MMTWEKGFGCILNGSLLVMFDRRLTLPQVLLKLTSNDRPHFLYIFVLSGQLSYVDNDL